MSAKAVTLTKRAIYQWQCPLCKEKYTTPADADPRWVWCPFCREKFTVDGVRTVL